MQGFRWQDGEKARTKRDHPSPRPSPHPSQCNDLSQREEGRKRATFNLRSTDSDDDAIAGADLSLLPPSTARVPRLLFSIMSPSLLCVSPPPPHPPRLVTSLRHPSPPLYQHSSSALHQPIYFPLSKSASLLMISLSLFRAINPPSSPQALRRVQGTEGLPQATPPSSKPSMPHSPSLATPLELQRPQPHSHPFPYRRSVALR